MDHTTATYRVREREGGGGGGGGGGGERTVPPLFVFIIIHFSNKLLPSDPPFSKATQITLVGPMYIDDVTCKI